MIRIRFEDQSGQTIGIRERRRNIVCVKAVAKYIDVSVRITRGGYRRTRHGLA